MFFQRRNLKGYAGNGIQVGILETDQGMGFQKRTDPHLSLIYNGSAEQDMYVLAARLSRKHGGSAVVLPRRGGLACGARPGARAGCAAPVPSCRRCQQCVAVSLICQLAGSQIDGSLRALSSSSCTGALEGVARGLAAVQSESVDDTSRQGTWGRVRARLGEEEAMMGCDGDPMEVLMLGFRACRWSRHYFRPSCWR